MKTFESIIEETENQSVYNNEFLCEKIIHGLERIYNTHFPVSEYHMTYNIFIQVLLLDPTYRIYRNKLVEILDVYKFNWKNIVFRFLITVNQEGLPELEKSIFENSFKTLPYVKKLEIRENGYLIETQDGTVEAYKLSKMINYPSLYGLLKQNVFQRHCHEAVDICKIYFPQAEIVTSELSTPFKGIHYHSYYKSNSDVIDISTNTLYKNNTFNEFYNPREIQQIPVCELEKQISKLPDEGNNHCKVLRLAIQNKMKIEKES